MKAVYTFHQEPAKKKEGFDRFDQRHSGVEADPGIFLTNLPRLLRRFRLNQFAHLLKKPMGLIAVGLSLRFRQSPVPGLIFQPTFGDL